MQSISVKKNTVPANSIIRCDAERGYLEEHCLPLHDRHCCAGSDVPKPEHRGTVTDDSHGVLLDCQVACLLWVLMDRHAHTRHTGGICHGEIIPRLNRKPE